jgi:RNA polymerase sigma factor (sigma-70 family)
MQTEKYAALIKKLTKRFIFVTKNYAAMCSAADLEQEAWVAFLKAKNGFDPSRGVKFITYAYVYISRELIKYVQKQTRNSAYSLDANASCKEEAGCMQDKDISELANHEDKIENLDMLRHLEKQLTDEESLILKERFAGKSYKDISSLTGIAPVTISKNIDKSLEKMRRAVNRELKTYEDN